MLATERERLFKQWLGEYKGLMFRIVRAFASSPEDQDDLFQEILVQVWSSLPCFRREAKPSTWIYKVALNTALGWQRVEKRHSKRRRTLMEASEACGPDESRPEDLESREMVEWLYTEIRKLPKVDSSLMVLYLDGLSYREMADILGISESNVGVKLNRIKKQLAETLKGMSNGV